ncbi:MAG TPA: twin-arginine translocase subunit TatC, partial [Mucilaginibacter sp.]|nr:twin-arginine translocase subunit TatC [Mucilaginibacter sp.]
TILVFAFYSWIYDNIIMAPSKSDFWTFRMMCDLGKILHRDMCPGKININLINTEMAGQFTLMIDSSLMIGLVLGIPYLLYELWLFIKPALHEKEKKAASGFVFYASILFLLGVLFGYFIITPVSLNFLAGFTVSNQIQNLFSVDSYLSSVTTLTLATGLVFELPILVYILANLGILTPKFMKESRRYAIVIILIVAAVVTPTPDMLTMTVVAIPLFLLYELSIGVAGAVQRRKKKREEEADAA